MLGLIIWAIVIIIIAECACPGLIWVILGAMALYIVIYLILNAIVAKFKQTKKL